MQFSCASIQHGVELYAFYGNAPQWALVPGLNNFTKEKIRVKTKAKVRDEPGSNTPLPLAISWYKNPVIRLTMKMSPKKSTNGPKNFRSFILSLLYWKNILTKSLVPKGPSLLGAGFQDHPMQAYKYFSSPDLSGEERLNTSCFRGRRRRKQDMKTLCSSPIETEDRHFFRHFP